MYIISKFEQRVQAFWTGSTWSHDQKDAKVYPSLNEACEVFSVPEGKQRSRAYNYIKV